MLVINPLVTHEFQTVVTAMGLEIFISSLNETGCKAVLLLKGTVRQSGIVGVLGQGLGILSSENVIEVGSCSLHGNHDIVDHGLGLLHVLKDSVELLNLASHFGRHVYQGIELVDTRIHNQIGRHDAVLVILVAEDEFLHEAGTFFCCLAGEAGRLGNVSAALAEIDWPVNQLGKHYSKHAHCQYRGQNNDTFFLFHRTKVLIIFELLGIHKGQK